MGVHALMPQVEAAQQPAAKAAPRTVKYTRDRKSAGTGGGTCRRVPVQERYFHLTGVV